MKTTASISSVRKVLANASRPVVLVPTMGALHAGHMELVTQARKLAGPDGTVAVSLFVNPTQFGPKEDLNRYPRPRVHDLKQCREAGVDLVYEPNVAAMYARDHSVYVDEETLSRRLCGGTRPGHFRGVCTVVSKLFNIVQPDTAVFGQKDYQQLAVIRRMVRDLDFPIKIVGVPTIRERDGLAMSSRNLMLSPEARAQAPALYQALKNVRTTCKDGQKSVAVLRRQLMKLLGAVQDGVIDYAEIVDAQNLNPIRRVERPAVIAIAVKFGKTRLIDNILIR